MTDDSEAPNRPVITTEQVRLFEKAEAQIEGFFEEIGNISKKKPDDAINKFKLGFINQVLETANRLLGEDYRPFPNFEQFDVDALPTTSDVVTMLSQYLRTMDRFRCDHTQKDFRGDYSWNLPNGSPSIKAKRPKSFHA